MRHRIFTAASLVVQILLSASVGTQQAPAPVGYDDTPMQPNGKWRVHDGKRPQPSIVTPAVTNEKVVPAPSDALVLLGSGDDLGAWQMTDRSPATWMMKAGVLLTGKGMLQTKREFTDFQLHVEFATAPHFLRPKEANHRVQPDQ